MKVKKSKSGKKAVTVCASIIVVLLAVLVIKPDILKGISGGSKAEDGTAQSAGISLSDNGDIAIDTAQITEKASFFETKAGGITVGIFAVKASDGTIRTAFNTCQVCNGSPYAYFEQKNDTFQCQNCQNIFPLDRIGMEKGGCNPVPILDADRTEQDGQITIPSSLLEENAPRFQNWKQY